MLYQDHLIYVNVDYLTDVAATFHPFIIDETRRHIKPVPAKHTWVLRRVVRKLFWMQRSLPILKVESAAWLRPFLQTWYITGQARLWFINVTYYIICLPWSYLFSNLDLYKLKKCTIYIIDYHITVIIFKSG